MPWSSAKKPAKASKTGQEILADCKHIDHIAKFEGYATRNSPWDTDIFTRQAMKEFLPADEYKALKGKTKRGLGQTALATQLARYDRDPFEFSSLDQQHQSFLTDAIATTRARFKLSRKVQPLDLHEVGQFVDRGTSAGWTFPGKRKGEVMREGYSEAKWLSHRMKQETTGFDPFKVAFPFCKAGHRGVLADVSEPKDRLVWIYPFEMTIVEGTYAQPLISAYKSLRTENPMLNGMNSDDRVMDWIARQKGHLLGVDLSAFDTTVSVFLIRQAFDILSDNIEWEFWNGKLVPPKHQLKWANLWKNLIHYFIHTTIVMPDGNVYRKHSGIPSGSWFTQLVGSVVNYIAVTYALSCQGLVPKNLVVLSDDSGCSVDTAPNLVQLSVDMDTINLKVNTVKTDSTEEKTEFKLLGYMYRRGYKHKEFKAWMEAALYPDGAIYSFEQSLSRMIGIFISGGFTDLRFCAFFRFYQTFWWEAQSGLPPEIRLPASSLRYINQALGQDIPPEVGFFGNFVVNRLFL